MYCHFSPAVPLSNLFPSFSPFLLKVFLICLEIWTHSCLQSGHCVHGAACRPVSLTPGFDRTLLQMPVPLFLFCEAVCFLQEECYSLHPGPVSQDRPCARGVGARALVGLESLMGPHGNSLNFTVSTEPPLCPSIWRLWFPSGRERLPFFTWRDTHLAGQVGEMHLDVCSLFTFFSSFTLHSSFQPCWMVPFLESLWGFRHRLVWFSSCFSSTCTSSSLLS